MPTGSRTENRSLAVAAFAVWIQIFIQSLTSELAAPACIFVSAWLIAYAQKRKSIHLPSFPTVLLRRTLFLRKHHPRDLSSFLSGSPLSFLFIFCTDCTVMSAFRSTLHSLVLSPDLQLVYWITTPFGTYLPTSFLYYLIDAIIRKRTVPSCFPSCIFPVSDFRLCRVFILPVNPLSKSVIFQNIRCCDSSLLFCVLNCGIYSIVTELWS